ncbi:cytochrome c biogenesis protein ResB [Mesobacillus zeae]|uniref:Cytochrome c biogenesis protein n=1 Tax=Mesobacillus zeae TaxID=1917180 RepID=A0A398BBZ9_9BACI|nr:cytochrome c biogenesis protein ResB [Mesobacillus zeae]RID87337.1 cytochrome c biogenesis protein [Mesobacillus zeae]
MNDVKCECGHVNPHGTVLCESCGKVLEEKEESKKLLDMRYEGSARRSQTYNKTIVDKIWNFFSSVKVGVILIVVTLIASSLGTILPQEMYIPQMTTPAEYYEDQYGWFGKLYYELDFNNLYSSWWYLLLIASIGVSLVICSLDRVIPLYRALKNQRVERHEGFMKRQRLYGVSEQPGEEAMSRLEQNLKAKKYHIRKKNGSILAEKNRFSRWGPYVNHIGLIIFLIGAMLRFVPGMYVDELLWIREGETKAIPGTDGQYYLKNNKFIFQKYDKKKDNEVFGAALDRAGMVAKNYQSNVTLYEKKGDTVAGESLNLKKLKEAKIRVNQPLKIDKFAIYQVDYKLDELSKMHLALQNKDTGEEIGTIKVNLYNPETKYDLKNGYFVELKSYFPDFEFDENSNPTTKSKVPNNPAFVFKMVTPEKPDGEVSFVAIRQTIEVDGNNSYKMAFKGVETKNVAALTIRKDLTLWILGFGGLIFMIGVIQGAYWNHRRLWVKIVDGKAVTAGHTNKNWYGFKRELEGVFEGTGMESPAEQLESGKKG